MSHDVRVQVPSLAPTTHQFNICRCGGMADALASGASVRKDVRVQVPPSAPIKLGFLKVRAFLLSPCRGVIKLDLLYLVSMIILLLNVDMNVYINILFYLWLLCSCIVCYVAIIINILIYYTYILHQIFSNDF